MVQYTEEIIIPYAEAQRADLEGSKPALAIVDNFRGQTTSKVTDLLEANGIHVCFLPPITTDLLQQWTYQWTNLQKRRFEAWYTKEVSKQLHGKDIDTVELQNINLRFAALKELDARWLVEMAEYNSSNPQFIVNSFNVLGFLENGTAI